MLENDLKPCLKKGEGKLLYIEVLRVLAIIAVIYVHTPLAWSSSEALNCSPWVSWLTLEVRPLFSINVPLFFMISGALMLPRSEMFDKKYFRRIYRMVVVLLAYWLIQYGACVLIVDATFGVRTYMRVLFAGQGLYGVSPDASWFFYAYLLLLIFMPFISMLANRMRNVDFLYLFAIQVVIGCILPYLAQLEGVEFTIISQPFCSFQPFSLIYGAYYMLLGYFAAVRFETMQGISKWSWPLVAGAIVFAGLALYTKNPLWLPPVAMGVFLSVKEIMNRLTLGKLMTKIVLLCGSAVFTVMITENIFRTLLADWCKTPNGTAEAWGISSYLVVWVGIVTVWLCSTALGIVLKQIPVVKRYL